MNLRVWSRHPFRALATLAILGMAGCHSPSRPSGKVLTLNNDDNGRHLSISVGDEFSLTLQTVGPGQYSEHPDISSPAVDLLTVSLVTPSNPGGPTQHFQFKAITQGRAVISIAHTVQNHPFEITVDVR